ncbi:centromere-associated protein E [Stegastes partitus]|uniref:Centromere-associated protein E n=1 Tax=Stegastes partitus TaxID=144197 RepID=A0A9Y4JGZ0_9TELE|nr:PREDICTED: centromere-associated protein E [Stegastes partitus]
MTEESAVKVCVRVRPLVAREKNAASENAEPVQLFWKTDKKSIHQIDEGNSTKSFSFDRVFTAEETTNQLYQNIAKPLVVSTVEGYNGTIFAYGQTSSGKTFTMMGSDHIPGVIPLAVDDVFQTIKTYPKKEFLLRVSYMEIYNETVTDLLVDSWKRKPLEIRETINKNIYVADLTEELVTSPAQALAWIRKGEKNRHYGKTKMNQRSSRSHTIFRMILESREKSDPVTGENADGAIIVSHLNLVDLAGSERASQTGAEGARFKEGCNINRSLFTLAQVIKKLTDENQKGFTNYRDSKLTRILQNSLGGNAKTVIICTITAATLDETLSTLQFASTAKKMKNDPHVTEVSDDGALLKRYRNEIVDLKRRLHEVSSVTKTTATEKEVLSQLLQEKDQLQREQEDRIRNLTKLLVTSSNLVPVQKMRKRRVTWGGKVLRLARPSTCGDGSSDLSFAEHGAWKRKADSCLMELGEDDEDFDSHWGIPDEPSDEMEISPSSVTVRSFGDSPRDFVSPDQMHELAGKVSNLEMQLEMESQQKEEAIAKVETLDCQVTELQLQLETEAHQKQETLEKMHTAEQRAAELELQLETETQQKLEAMEKVEMLEFRVADLERQPEEQSQSQTETDGQMREEFAETIQLCETLASEKDMVTVERDYLKQELGMFIEQTETLEKEKAALSQELEEKREMDEFKSLEEEIRRESENELQNEISSLKKAIKASELQCMELQNKLELMSEQLKNKTEFAEELQNMNGKDLVQEVAKLRRSLDDAEGLSRDTKKEWALLRSQKIALEETNVTLTDNHERMKAEVNSLRFQLETEKSRYKKMQTDLQKELNVAFDENTKLTTLLDGKVPKHLIDSVELERTVTSLNKELTASHEAEEALRAQLEELASFKTLPDQVDSLMKQVCELTEELHAVKTQKNNLLSLQDQCQEEALQLRNSLQMSQDEVLKYQEDLSAAALRETELNHQCAEVTQQLDSVRSDLEQSEVERSQLVVSMEERSLKLEESNQLRVSLEGKLNEMQQLIKDLEEKFADSEVSRTTEEEINKELQEQLNQLNEELQRIQVEKDALLSEQSSGVETSSEETEKLLSTVTSLTAERDEIRMNLQDHEEKANMTEILLESLQNELQEQKQKYSDLIQLHEQKESDMCEHMLRLTQELQCERDEKETLKIAGAQSSPDEVEKLLSSVASLTAERDQLKLDLQENVEMMIENQEELRAVLEKNHKQKEQIKQLETAQTSKLDGPPSHMSAHLEELQTRMQCELQEQQQLSSEPQSLKEEQEAQRLLQIQQLEEHLERTKEEVAQLKSDLQENIELMIENQEELRVSQEKIGALQEEITMLRSLKAELESRASSGNDTENIHHLQELKDQIQRLTEEFESVQAERDSLLSEKETNTKTSAEEMEKLLCRVMSLSEERDQLQEILEGLRLEKKQLSARLEDKMESLQTETAQLNTSLQTVIEHKKQMEDDLQENMNVLSSTQELLKSVQEELHQQKNLNSDLEKLNQEKEASLEQQISNLAVKLESAEAERNRLLSEQHTSHQTSTEEMAQLLCKVTSLTEERDQLQEILEGLEQEKKQLRAELEDKMESLQTEMRMLTEKLQIIKAERDSLLSEKESNCQTSTEETEKLLCRVTSLTEERDQLQEILEGLKEEKKQLSALLEERTEMISAIQTKLNQQEQLIVLHQSESEEREVKLQQEVQQLEGQMQMYRERQAHANAEADASQQLLSKANATIAALKEQFSASEQSTSEVKETMSSRLQNSTEQLQESFGKFQHFIDTCKYNFAALDKALGVQCYLKSSLTSLPRPTMHTYAAVRQQGLATVQSLIKTQEQLYVRAQGYRKMFEELVNKDLAVFEERQVQDMLLCRAQAPTYSVKDEDHTLREHRLPELLDKRQLYLRKMTSILEKLGANMASHLSKRTAEIQEREKFKEQLQTLMTNQPVSFSGLDDILNQELDRRSAVTQSWKMLLQGINDEQNSLFEELKQLEAQTDSQMREEKSKSSTLLQALEGTHLKTELSLLKDNQQLVLLLQQAEDEVKTLHAKNEQLEDAQIKANNRVSTHKQATQLLQTELQDSRAIVEETESTIQTLKSKLRESEKKASPTEVEMEKLEAKLVKMEVKLSSASVEHQQKIKRMTTLLNEKENSLRKLKETLRRSQQQGEESFLQGKELHARLTNPRGLVIKSSIQLEKIKLEEEVKELRLKIIELESLVSSQHAEINKWKSRAIKLKVKSKAEVDKPSSPCTPTKRAFPMTSDSSNVFSSPKKFLVTPKKILDSPRKVLESPRKLLDSPKVSLLDSPKSGFFDMGGSSELLSRTCPKQFFDNSSLGTIPDAAMGANKKEEWWPQSPKQEEMCKTQ